jgi:hypothetical protein
LVEYDPTPAGCAKLLNRSAQSTHACTRPLEGVADAEQRHVREVAEECAKTDEIRHRLKNTLAVVQAIPMILHVARGKVEDGKPRSTKLYSASGMAKLVRRLRKVAKLPATFTLDACRHGSMTELEEAELRRPRTGPVRAQEPGV